MKWKLVPEEIDRATCRPMLDVWNRCMADCSTLETTWPQLVAAAPPLDADIEEAVKLAQSIADDDDFVVGDTASSNRRRYDTALIARALLRAVGEL